MQEVLLDGTVEPAGAQAIGRDLQLINTLRGLAVIAKTNVVSGGKRWRWTPGRGAALAGFDQASRKVFEQQCVGQAVRPGPRIASAWWPRRALVDRVSRSLVYRGRRVTGHARHNRMPWAMWPARTQSSAALAHMYQ